MPKSRRRLGEASKSLSIGDAGEFWDTHSFLDYDDAKEVDFDIDIKSVKYYYALERDLAEKLREIAKARGISAKTLLNLWVKEKFA
jgi:hypothetical protein